MNNDLAQFSIRYSLLAGQGIGCAICGDVLDAAPVLCIYRDGVGLAPRRVCYRCSRKLCPHLHAILVEARIYRDAVQTTPSSALDDWYPQAEYALKTGTVVAEDVPAGPYDAAVCRDALPGNEPAAAPLEVGLR
jgi:hypothetical protein